jgi:hypothetical protein
MPTHALDAARRGWFVFPIKKNAKVPPLVTDWEHNASDDTMQILVWSEKHPGCNWGLATGPSNLTVVDIDPKNGGMKTFNELKENPETPFPPTFTVKTQSGGIHLYYQGPTPKSSANKLGPGIDTRSTGGYVVLLGSKTPKGEYSIYKGDTPHTDTPAPLPAWIAPRIGAAREKTAAPAPLSLDDPADIARAASWRVKEAPIDVPAYQIAARVKDFGLSEDFCINLMWELYAGRCDEPWEYDVLHQKIKNAYRYGQNPPGVDSLDAARSDFTPVERTPIPATWADTIDFSNIPRRRWLLGNRYLKGFVTVTIAPGGAGKSTLMLTEALSIASNAPIAGQAVHQSGRVWYYNTEDPLEEIKRRAAAVCIHHGVSAENLAITSGLDHPLCLVKESRSGTEFNNEQIQQIIQFIKDNNIILFLVDPFIRAHRVNENDNNAIDKVMLTFSRIASITDCAIGVAHHARKGNSAPGNADSARGASSLLGAARIAHTITSGVSAADATKFGFDPARAEWYFRLDDAKANLTAPGEGVRWYERVSISLNNGESVGSIKPIASISRKEILSKDQRSLVDAVFKLWNGPVSAYEMASEIRRSIPELGEKSSRTWVNQIKQLFHGVTRWKDGKGITATVAEGRKTNALFLVEMGGEIGNSDSMDRGESW